MYTAVSITIAQFIAIVFYHIVRKRECNSAMQNSVQTGHPTEESNVQQLGGSRQTTNTRVFLHYMGCVNIC